MDLLQKHRTSLFSAFSSEYAEFDRALQAELARRDAFSAEEKQKLQEEVNSLTNAARKAEELQAENELLRDLIQQKDVESRATIPAQGALEQGLSECSVLQEQYTELEQKFDRLTERYDDVLAAHRKLIEKYKGEKTTIKAWIRYHERHKQRLAGKEARLSSTSREKSEAAADENPGAGAEGTSATPAAESVKPTVNDLHATVRDCRNSEGIFVSPQSVSLSPIPPVPNHLAVATPSRGQHPSLEANALVTTSGNALLKGHREVEQDQKMQALESVKVSPCPKRNASSDSQDLPIVISERPVKRRRTHVEKSRAKEEQRPSIQPGSALQPIQIKGEQASSSPPDAGSLRQHGGVADSLDLDEVGDRVDTPRKRRALQRLLRHSQENARAMEERPQSREQDVAATRSMIQSPTRRDRRLHLAAYRDEGFRSLSEPVDVVASQRTSAGTLGSNKANVETPLQAKSTNTRVLPRKDTPTKFRAQQAKFEREARARMVLGRVMAEDGEQSPPSSNITPTSKGNAIENVRDQTGAKTTSSRIQLHQRLGSLLETRSPASEKLSLEKSHRAAQGPKESSRPAEVSTPDQTSIRDLRSVRSGPSRPSTSTPRTKTGSDREREAGLISRKKSDVRSAERPDAVEAYKEPGPDRPEREPYRARPVHRLSLEHFKINPDFNQGQDFAFVETVRKRDQRKCLPGCTRPDCCGGQFRKLIELGGVPKTPDTSLHWHSSQDDDDERVLKEHLGDDRERLKTLTTEGRRELLIQARTKQFADKHGRHRHAYERRTTPPGFWRTDMPTTQELQDDREESRKMERLQVEERFRDAMRGGSRWKFRDE